MEKKLVNPEVAMLRIAAQGQRDVVEHFKDERGPKGKWPNLKSPRKRGGTKILQDTGILRASIRSKAAAREAIVFTDLVYAATHHFGDSSRNIPARPYMWISKKAKNLMRKTLARFIMRK